jgi:two-component system, sensor histidine kinase and response regulator
MTFPPTPSHFHSDLNSSPTANERLKRTLLVVDDEEGPRFSIRIVFKDEYNVLLASSAQAALELARNNDIDVAVLDIMMSGMNGVELLRHLKKHDPTIEVIMLTAYETLDTAREALRLGACDYLNKPFDIPAIRKSVADAVQKRQETLELNDSSRKLELLQQQIHEQKLQSEMMKTKGEIYASVLHDLNSPLTVISGFAEMINISLEDAAAGDESRFETIRGDLGKLADQVTRCFEISRRYLGFLREGHSTCQRVKANQILSDLRDLLRRHPAQANHELGVSLLPEDVIAAINGTDLLQILLNLTINALQSTETPHVVQIRAHLLQQPLDISKFEDSETQRLVNRDGFNNETPLLLIVIKDNGPGIPPDVMGKIFNEKITTKEEGKGTGLGLSIVKRLITQAAGVLHVQTTPGAGTTFTVALPTVV